MRNDKKKDRGKKIGPLPPKGRKEVENEKAYSPPPPPTKPPPKKEKK